VINKGKRDMARRWGMAVAVIALVAGSIAVEARAQDGMTIVRTSAKSVDDTVTAISAYGEKLSRATPAGCSTQ
jgi:hypothetical protein